MRAIIDIRLESANANVPFEKVFENETVCNTLIKISGGQPSVLMGMLPDAVSSEGLPISDLSLDRIRRENKRDFKRPLMLEDWKILEVIRRGEQFERSADQEERFRLLLESRSILQYVNDEEWYGLNPFIEMLTPPEGLESDDSTSE